jgi:cobalt/nickel transport system permease protein
MHVDAFDQFHHQHSRIHNLDPRIKVIVTIVFILSNALLPDGSWSAFALSWLLLLIANDQSRLGLEFSLKRSIIALPFALVAVSAIFSPQGQILAVWDLGFITLMPTDFGIIRFISILFRSWLSVQMAILLVATTQFPDIIHAFEHLKLPKMLTTVIAFLFRYLFVLTNEVFRILRARDSRSAGVEGFKKGGSVLWRARVAGSMAGQLFLRSYDRSDRIFHAMISRGYSGHLRTLNPHIINQADWFVFGVVMIFIIIIQFIGWIA